MTTKTTLGAAPDDIAHFAAMSRELDGSIRQRIIVERAIIRHAVTAFIAAGCSVSVDYDEGDIAVKRSKDIAEIMKAIGACDMEYLHVHQEGKRTGTIMLVYGNDGWDVISDYHTSLEELLASTNEYADSLS